MSFLQQPELFASEPTTGLVGLGLFLTIAATAFISSLLVAYALSSQRKGKQEIMRNNALDTPQTPPSPIGSCGAIATS
jgi:hypothetical protein